MRKNIFKLFVYLSMATAVITTNVLTADASDFYLVDEDGDIVDNPWADLFPTEDKTEQTASVNVALNKTATSSGNESDEMSAANALDNG